MEISAISTESFSFFDKVYRLIAGCVEMPWYLNMMNAMYKGFFKSHSSLWQGDHFSLYLFILMNDVLSCMLKKALEDNRTNHYFHLRGCPFISHLLYVDDMLLFANGEKRSLKKLLKFLTTYEAWSGQAINKEKYAIFMSSQINSSKRRELLRIIGFSKGWFPITYLGAPICPKIDCMNARALSSKNS